MDQAAAPPDGEQAPAAATTGVAPEVPSSGGGEAGSSLALPIAAIQGRRLQRGASDVGSSSVREALISGDSVRELVFRILKAELLSTQVTLGWMSPYARVVWSCADGRKVEVCRTAKHRMGHKNPVWDHTCPGFRFLGRGSGETVHFQVLQDKVGRPSIICGEAAVAVDELLAGSQAASSGGPEVGLQKDLPLGRSGEDGYITVQAILISYGFGETARRKNTSLDSLEDDDRGPPMVAIKTGCELDMAEVSQMVRNAQSPSSWDVGSAIMAASRTEVTDVEPSLFEQPVSRLGVSGGTAPFFRLLLCGKQHKHVRDYWIGKDKARAEGEVAFYEEVLRLRDRNASADGSSASGMEDLMEFMFEYAGILTAPEAGVPLGTPPRQLLVLRNAKHGYRSLRMLDVKIGERTGAAGWQGKSRLGALKQNLLDGVTNSAAEGFRLEGFSDLPPALASMDPLLDIGGTSDKRKHNKALRIMLQRMTGPEMFMHFLDVHEKPADPGDALLHTMRSPMEHAEITLNEMLKKLVHLAMSCRSVPAPQKWIGSSVLLGFEAGSVPERRELEEALRDRAQVTIFDWGRSELTKLEKHMMLPTAEQADRTRYWRFYCRGIDRLAWEAVRAYFHRFSNDEEWRQVIATVYDFDSMSANDFIGRAVLKLEPSAAGTVLTVPLTDTNGRQVRGPGGPSTLTYCVAERRYPESSRLLRAWRVTILRASCLPVCNMIRGLSDPFVSLLALSRSAVLRVRQETQVKTGTLDPAWNATLELPIVRKTPEDGRSALAETLGEVRPLLGIDRLLPVMLPAVDVEAAASDEAFKRWVQHLDEAKTAFSTTSLLAFNNLRSGQERAGRCISQPLLQQS